MLLEYDGTNTNRNRIATFHAVLQNDTSFRKNLNHDSTLYYRHSGVRVYLLCINQTRKILNYEQ